MRRRTAPTPTLNEPRKGQWRGTGGAPRVFYKQGVADTGGQRAATTYDVNLKYLNRYTASCQQASLQQHPFTLRNPQSASETAGQRLRVKVAGVDPLDKPPNTGQLAS